MKIHPAALVAAAVLSCSAASCVTYLSSGQFGHDSIFPPAIDPAADRAGVTMVFVGGSEANGSLYPDDMNLFAQAGLLRAWRRPMETVFFDGQAGVSGWYGEADLHDHGAQYPNGAPGSLAFYGGSAQVGTALGIRATKSLMIDLGLRGAVAYEDGPYRAFRAAAASTLSVIDQSPTGWSGNLGEELALTISLDNDLYLRLVQYSAFLYPDIGKAVSTSSMIPNDLLLQLSLALRYRNVSLAAAWNGTILNRGVSASIGYILP